MDASSFPLIDRYMGTLLDLNLTNLQPDRTFVVESSRRLRREASYSFRHILWWLWLADGRSAVSVVPGAGARVSEIVRDVISVEHLHNPALVARLREAANAVLARNGHVQIDRVHLGLQFACDAAHLRQHQHGDCRRLGDASVPPAQGLSLPAHCFPDGLVYGVVADGCVVSVAYAHRTGLMEDQVADIGIETAPAYRRQGLAQTALSAVVVQMASQGGEALYGCGPDNLASVATARSVGFVPYATSLVLSAPALPD